MRSSELDILLEPLRVFLHQVGDLAPRLLLALVVLLAGWLLAKAARVALVKGLRAVNFPLITERAGLDGFLQAGGLRSDTTALLGLLTYWLVIFGALVIGFNTLGLAHVTDLLGRVILFVPRLMVALLVLAFGAYFARFIETAILVYCRNAHIQDAELLGRLARYAILAFVILIALEQGGVAGDFLRQSFLILLAGLVFALALALGLGGRDWAAALLERWWPRQK
jgi:Conserved TM helix